MTRFVESDNCKIDTVTEDTRILTAIIEQDCFILIPTQKRESSGSHVQIHQSLMLTRSQITAEKASSKGNVAITSESTTASMNTNEAMHQKIATTIK